MNIPTRYAIEIVIVSLSFATFISVFAIIRSL
jgi:hypothetical protein